MHKILKLFLSLLIPMSVGFVSGMLTIEGVNGWYMEAQKPFFNPPNWLFGPVWTLLYLMMGFSLYLLWIAPKSIIRKRAIIFFMLQLALNFCWSPLFFLYQALLLAFIEILLMWITILLTIRYSKQVTLMGAGLLVPYLLWVSFATVLNGAIYWLNR